MDGSKVRYYGLFRMGQRQLLARIRGHLLLQQRTADLQTLPSAASALVTARMLVCPRCGQPMRLERVLLPYVIERRWCPRCRTYHEDAVTAALPRHRLDLHVLLFVVEQKVALGLSYRKIQHELHAYFGLTVSAGELPGMVAEVAALFGPAYARLLELMRLSAAIHVDETSWRSTACPTGCGCS